MNVYIYAADIYCENCGEAIQEGGEVAELWAEFYHDYNLQTTTMGR